MAAKKKTGQAKRTSKKGRPAGGETARDKILEAAYRVVQEQGAAHLTLENVAWEAGVSKGGLLYHFRSKEDLIRGMVEEHVRQHEQRMAESLGSDPSVVDMMRYMLEVELQCCDDSRVDTDEAGAALLPALLENPALLEPAEHMISEMNRKIDELEDFALGYILRLAVDGLHFGQLMGIGLIEEKQREAVIRRMLQLLDTLR